MKISGNIQQWTHIYALLKILGTGNVEFGDNPDICSSQTKLPVSFVTREDVTGTVIYRITPEKIIVRLGEKQWEISRSDCLNTANDIFRQLSRLSETESTIDLPELFSITDAEPASYDKSDFSLTFFDPDSGFSRIAAVSLKPLFPCFPLLKANRASNLKYDILNIKLSNPEANKINRIEGKPAIYSRLDEISRLGGKLKYTSAENKIFLDNLSMIDLHFPRLLAGIVHTFYTTGISSIATLTEEMKKSNPYKIREELILKNNFYEYKIKQFLFSLASGMRPAKIYRGYSTVPAFLFITPQGNLSLFSPHNRKIFDEMLYRNTILSAAGEDDYKFGYIEKENGQWLIKLNTEILFTSTPH
ncbi:HpaII family restriction endonuclease [Coprobacter tertius]|uniref:HpaII family restriction endonuclease n=1 Tax=Coprobacter tertius TaxID=2944915 RepID=A0ABT1MJ68_9BACT|nr:HpaII family restriction endonuclease [Coprobacter tertius]MCP9612404.1 HpaII family restriction endonuclease [Coprobacter tertius]